MPWLVSVHLTPSQGGVSWRRRWAKLSTPAVTSRAVPASTSHVPVVKTDLFTEVFYREPKKPLIRNYKGKVCSLRTFLEKPRPASHWLSFAESTRVRFAGSPTNNLFFANAMRF